MYGTEGQIRFADPDANPWMFCDKRGEVGGVSTVDGTTLIRVDGGYYPLEQILEIMTAAAAAADNGEET